MRMKKFKYMYEFGVQEGAFSSLWLTCITSMHRIPFSDHQPPVFHFPNPPFLLKLATQINPKMKRYSPFLLPFTAICLLLLFITSCSSESESSVNTPPTDSVSTPETSGEVLGFRYSWKLDAGTSWNIKTLETTTMIFNPGTEQETREETSTTINRKANLREIDKELAMNIIVTYSDIVDGSGKDGKKGTSDPNDPRMGKALEIRVDPTTGQVLTMRGAGAIFQAAGMSDNKELANALIKESINNEFYIYPDGPVQVGDSWSRSGKLRSPFGLDYVHTYTLDKQMNGQGFIKRSTQFTSGEGVPELNPEGQVFNFTGTSTADFNVDDATGMIFSKVENTVLEGRAIEGGSPDKVSLRIEISSISEMTIQ